ncbi:hypothetical protein ANO11243_056130 [Dothideomycetidae sp. 11243]|nr:hypothetical protein ANO11243_056130 [fungal sp. No.11243]
MAVLSHGNPNVRRRWLSAARWHRKRGIAACHSTLYFALACFVAVIYFCSSLATNVGGATRGPSGPLRGYNAAPQAVHVNGIRSKYAFATLLYGSTQELEYEDDNYLIATRILAYQLLHAPETRLRNPDIPFLVLVTSNVKESARDRLRKDGATVIEVPQLDADWLAPGKLTWSKTMTKLRLWELVDFDRIAFLDADHLLVRPMDDIFSDPAVEEQVTKPSDTIDVTAPLPSTYVFAGNNDYMHIPRKNEQPWHYDGNLCAGFFVIKPDVDLLRHYISFLQQPGSFDSALPEQNLLNVVHHWKGRVPWKQLNHSINIYSPAMYDIDYGARSVHEKWWEGRSPAIKEWMKERRWKMEGFFEARDLAVASKTRW